MNLLSIGVWFLALLGLAKKNLEQQQEEERRRQMEDAIASYQSEYVWADDDDWVDEREYYDLYDYDRVGNHFNTEGWNIKKTFIFCRP